MNLTFGDILGILFIAGVICWLAIPLLLFVLALIRGINRLRYENYIAEQQKLTARLYNDRYQAFILREQMELMRVPPTPSTPAPSPKKQQSS